MEEVIDNDTHNSNQHTWIYLHAGSSTDLSFSQNCSKFLTVKQSFFYHSNQKALQLLAASKFINFMRLRQYT